MIPLGPLFNAHGMSMDWRQWFARADQTTEAQRRVGTTADRPLPRDCYPGMQYFDTTLGYPIWARTVIPAGVTWIDATGATV